MVSQSDKTPQQEDPFSDHSTAFFAQSVLLEHGTAAHLHKPLGHSLRPRAHCLGATPFPSSYPKYLPWMQSLGPSDPRVGTALSPL